MEKLNPRISWPISGIFIVIILGVIGFYFYKFYKQPIDVSTNIISQTVDWPTYSNSEYGFSFKYPSFLEYNETKGTIRNMISIGYLYSKNSGSVDIDIIKSKLDPNNIYGMFGKVDLADLKTINVSGKTSYMYTDGDAGYGGYVVNIPKDNMTIVLLFSDCTFYQVNVEDYRERILSTFYFTNQ